VSKAGVLAVAVSDNESAVRDFLAQGGYTFPVMVGGDDIAAQYGVRAIPTTFVIDPQGRIVKTIVGATTASDMAKLVDDLTR